jgi:hypothetical protein
MEARSWQFHTAEDPRSANAPLHSQEYYATAINTITTTTAAPGSMRTSTCAPLVCHNQLPHDSNDKPTLNEAPVTCNHHTQGASHVVQAHICLAPSCRVLSKPTAECRGSHHTAMSCP